MKHLLRFILACASLVVAYFAAYYAEGFTLVPLGNGHYEGTPLTMATFFVVFPLSAVCTFVIGNIMISRHLRPKEQNIDVNTPRGRSPSTGEVQREDRLR